MKVGLTSTLTHTIAAILLAGFLPGVNARCWVDSVGFEHCDALSSAARAGIAFAFFAVFFVLLSVLVAYRRRRAAQANLVYIQPQPTGADGAFHGFAGQPPYAPQYPPPAHGGMPPYTYDPNAGFAPPAGEPPRYAPPSGAPPVIQGKGAYPV